jgi:hypothetical protein
MYVAGVGTNGQTNLARRSVIDPGRERREHIMHAQLPPNSYPVPSRRDDSPTVGIYCGAHAVREVDFRWPSVCIVHFLGVERRWADKRLAIAPITSADEAMKRE